MTLFEMLTVPVAFAGGDRAGFWSCCRKQHVGRLGAACPTLDLHLAPFGARDPKPRSPSFPIMNALQYASLEKTVRGGDENDNIEPLQVYAKTIIASAVPFVKGPLEHHRGSLETGWK